MMSSQALLQSPCDLGKGPVGLLTLMYADKADSNCTFSAMPSVSASDGLAVSQKSLIRQGVFQWQSYKFPATCQALISDMVVGSAGAGRALCGENTNVGKVAGRVQKSAAS